MEGLLEAHLMSQGSVCPEGLQPMGQPCWSRDTLTKEQQKEPVHESLQLLTLPTACQRRFDKLSVICGRKKGTEAGKEAGQVFVYVVG